MYHIKKNSNHTTTIISLLILVISTIANVYGQQKHSAGIYISPQVQSAYTYNSSNTAITHFKPTQSLSLEVGLSYNRQLNDLLSVGLLSTLGILNSSTLLYQKDINSTLNKRILTNENGYYITCLPVVHYKPMKAIKRLSLSIGLGFRYITEVSAENYSKVTIDNNTTIENKINVTGTYINPIPNEKRINLIALTAINYTVHLSKKMNLDLGLPYQMSLNNTYTGVYKFTRNNIVENGGITHKMHTLGVSFVLSYAF